VPTLKLIVVIADLEASEDEAGREHRLVPAGMLLHSAHGAIDLPSSGQKTAR
jgi:hypothetical protein